MGIGVTVAIAFILYRKGVPAMSANPDDPSTETPSKPKPKKWEITFGLVMLALIVAVAISGAWKGYEWWNDRDYRAALDERDCRMDSQCWGEKHHTDAETQCRPLVEQYAKYQHEWTDGFGEWKFPKWSLVGWDNSDGMLVYEGDQINFQNGFGAWQRMYYSCYYSPDESAAVQVVVRPR